MAKQNWPYPVLDADGGDYVNCAFQPSIGVSQTPTSYAFNIRLDLGSDTLESAIREGLAQYAVQVHCPRTAYRTAFLSRDGGLRFDVAEGLLRGAFSVRPYVVAAKGFALASNEFAPIFDGLSFSIEPGFVLATAPPVEFVAEKRLDDVANIRAIFQIVMQPDDNKKVVEYDFEADRIAIFLPTDQYERYDQFKRRSPYAELMVCTLVLPALTLALIDMFDLVSGEADTSHRWSRALKKRLESLGVQRVARDDAVTVAQLLLDLPIKRAFAAIADRDQTSE